MKTIHFRVSNEDIEGYASLSGDFNPIHLNREYAREHGYADKIAHGMLTMAKLWSLTANELQINQLPIEYDLSFVSPLYAGEEVTLILLELENKIQIKAMSQERIVVKGTILLHVT